MGSGVLYLVLLLRSGNPSKHWITECPWCLMVNVFLRLWEWKIWNHLKGMTRQQPSVTQHTHLRHARTWHLTFLHLSTAAALINGFTEMLLRWLRIQSEKDCVCVTERVSLKLSSSLWVTMATSSTASSMRLILSLAFHKPDFSCS